MKIVLSLFSKLFSAVIITIRDQLAPTRVFSYTIFQPRHNIKNKIKLSAQQHTANNALFAIFLSYHL